MNLREVRADEVHRIFLQEVVSPVWSAANVVYLVENSHPVPAVVS